MLKRVLAVILCVILLSTSVAAMSFSAYDDGSIVSEDGRFKYIRIIVEDDMDIAYITRYIGTEADVVVPTVIDGAYVMKINDMAFTVNKTVETISLPESITNIGAYAFYACSNLKSINIPNMILLLEENVFDGCTSLTSVTGGNGLTEIKRYAFNNCTSLSSFTPGKSLKVIEDCAFSNCQSLESFTVPVSVKTIGVSVFSGCTSLTKINVDENNEYFSSVDGVLFSKDRTILKMFPYGRRGAYSIPDGVTNIAERAFQSVFYLTDVFCPASVTTIGAYAFYSCKITSFYAEYGLRTIGDYAFRDTTKMTVCTLPSSVTSIGTEIFKYDTNITIRCESGSTAASYAAAAGLTYTLQTGIVIQSLPDRINYTLGDSLDTRGLAVVDKYADASVGYPRRDCILSGYSSLTTGVKTITVTARRYSTSFEVVVSYEGITVKVSKSPDKINYTSMETLDATGIEVVYVSPDGAETAATNFVIVGAIDKTKAGEQSVAVLVDNSYATSFSIFVFPARGDIAMDGEITIADALMSFKHTAGLFILGETACIAADVDGSGDVTIRDSLLLMRYVAGLSEDF